MKLFGLRGSRVLFLSADDRAVVVDAVTASADGPVFPAYEVIKENWQRPDPARIPTRAFETAARAFAGVTAGSNVPGERTYAVPKRVRDTVRTAQAWHDAHGRGSTDVALTAAKALTAGRPASTSLVRHLAEFFETYGDVPRVAGGWSAEQKGFPSNARILWDLWGGDAARDWSLGIVSRDAPVTAAAPMEDPLAGEIVAVEPAMDEEDDSSAELTDVVDPRKPHLFEPDVRDEFMCSLCGFDETAMVHCSTMTEQVRGQFGDEAAKLYEAELAKQDAIDAQGAGMPSSGFYMDRTPAALAAGGVAELPPHVKQIALVAGAFFGDHNAEECEYYAEHDPHRDEVGVVYVKMPNGSWAQWDGDRVQWQDSGDASDAGLIPLDHGSAYSVAMRQVELPGAASSVPIFEINPVEAAMIGEARDDVHAEVDGLYGSEPQYFIETGDEDPDQVHGLYADQMGAWSKWDAGVNEWVPAAEPGTKTSIDADSAHEAALWLSSAAGSPQPVSTMIAAGPTDSSGYTPEERSKNAQQQVRDRFGRFAKTGSRVSTDKGSGTITKINPSVQKVKVDFDSGASRWIPAADIALTPGAAAPSGGTAAKPAKPSHPRVSVAPADGYTGTPRADSVAKARLYGMLPPLTTGSIYAMMRDYSSWIANQRSYAPGKRASSFPLKPPYASKPTKPARPADTITRVPGDTIVRAPNDTITPLPDTMAAASGTALTPETTDVAPLHLAVVDSLDRSAVMDLLALVPSSATSTKPMLYRRQAGGWVRDDAMLSKIMSTTPPPLVTLDEGTYKDVLTQVDSYFKTAQKGSQGSPAEPVAASAETLYNEFGELLPSLNAAGGLDRNRGGAEKLRRYWTVGPGGAKIRWGEGGDWYRCVRHLSKYLGVRAKGYCQLRHQEMVRMSTAKHAQLLHGKHGVRGSAEEYTDEQITEAITAAASDAQMLAEMMERILPATVNDVEPEGARFRIPVVVPEGVETGDGRIFKPMSLSHRDLPIPLLWQMATGDGHDGSVIVGRIDTIERIANGLGNAYGVFDTSPHAQEVERLVRSGFLRGVSADLDQFEADTEASDENADDDNEINNDKVIIKNARVMAVTAVPKPAFQECTIELVDEEPTVVEDGVYGEQGPEPVTASAAIAESIPVTPPAMWFRDPKLKEPTPLTVTDDGRVYGHIAAWHVDHIGIPFATKPPRSRSGYSYFHTGVLRTAEGDDVAVGQLTLSGGHAPLDLTADAAVKHYDDTASAVADVHAGEDAHGIWVSGALRPGVTPQQIRAFRASAPSGDWRPINGRLELVAVCQVNVPGFPVTRARVASGYVTALVAAGASPLVQLKTMSTPERVQLLAQMETARQRVLAVRAEKAQLRVQSYRSSMTAAATPVDAELAAKIEALRQRFAGPTQTITDFADYSTETRGEYAKKGWALKDGSYPIANTADLKNAIRAYGRASKGDRSKVRRHIMKRARGLGRADLIPSSWTSASIEERWADARTAFQELAAQTASGSMLHLADRFDPQQHPRDVDTGKFRHVMYRLRDQLESVPGQEENVRELDNAIAALDHGKVDAASQAAQKVVESADKAIADTQDPVLLENLRAGYGALGEVMARLPMAQGDPGITYRWTDLPPNLQNLVEDVMGRLRSHVSAETYKEATQEVEQFKTGVDYASSDDIQTWLSRMLGYLLD